MMTCALIFALPVRSIEDLHFTLNGSSIYLSEHAYTCDKEKQKLRMEVSTSWGLKSRIPWKQVQEMSTSRSKREPVVHLLHSYTIEPTISVFAHIGHSWH